MRRRRQVKPGSFSLVLLLIFIFTFVGFGARKLFEGSASGNPGASTAVCTPSPCTQASTWATKTIQVYDSDGADKKLITQTYYIERPNNLTNSSSNLAPLVVHSGSPKGIGQNDENWEEQSATAKYVLLYIPPTHNIGGIDQYALPTTSPAGANQAPKNCGTSGTSTCDDIPWIQAVLQRIVCSGPAPCENIDPAKVYVTGESKGGGMTEAAVCDSRTSNFFTAFSVVSNNLISYSTSNNQGVPPYCPAILGTSNGFGGAAGLPSNNDLSGQWIFGDSDGLMCTNGAPLDCLNTGYTDSSNRWHFSAPQLAGESNPPAPAMQAGSNVVIGRKIGCSGAASTVLDYGPTTKFHKRIYTGCTVPERATETILVHTGGHACPGLAQVDSFDCAAEGWAFFSTYGGPSSNGGTSTSSTSTSSTSTSSTSSGSSTSTSSTSTSSTSTSSTSTSSTSTSSTSSGGGPKPGDCNSDGHTDVVDLSILISHFNLNYQACDFNSDGIDNIIDMSILLSNWG